MPALILTYIHTYMHIYIHTYMLIYIHIDVGVEDVGILNSDSGRYVHGTNC